MGDGGQRSLFHAFNWLLPPSTQTTCRLRTTEALMRVPALRDSDRATFTFVASDHLRHLISGTPSAASLLHGKTALYMIL
jgi:hypothetical protein